MAVHESSSGPTHFLIFTHANFHIQLIQLPKQKKKQQQHKNILKVVHITFFQLF